MSMEKEWNELKAWLTEMREGSVSDAPSWDAYTAVALKMAELERLNLPERVAELLEKANNDKINTRWKGTSILKIEHWVAEHTARALRTGDTTELEAWQK